jgi:hypothetical protein
MGSPYHNSGENGKSGVPAPQPRVCPKPELLRLCMALSTSALYPAPQRPSVPSSTSVAQAHSHARHHSTSARHLHPLDSTLDLQNHTFVKMSGPVPSTPVTVASEDVIARKVRTRSENEERQGENSDANDKTIIKRSAAARSHILGGPTSRPPACPPPPRPHCKLADTPV